MTEKANDMESQFQSTLLQEERLERLVYHLYHINFNPRSYKRSDTEKIDEVMKTNISIHAPTRGATR